MTKHTHSFDAVSETGDTYTIDVHQQYERMGAGENAQWEETFVDLKTQDGHEVNRIDQGTYDVLTAGGNVRVTSSDPQAP